jgi:hypothetical protein
MKTRYLILALLIAVAGCKKQAIAAVPSEGPRLVDGLGVELVARHQVQ